MEEMRTKRIRSVAGTAVIVALATVVVIVAVRARGGALRESLGRGTLVACALLVGLRLFGIVRKRLRAQRAAPLYAPCRSPDRFDVVPAELGRILAEVSMAAGSREQYEKGLAARLGALVERRARLWDRRASGSGNRPTAAEVPAAKGVSVGELDRIVSGIEET